MHQHASFQRGSGGPHGEEGVGYRDAGEMAVSGCGAAYLWSRVGTMSIGQEQFQTTGALRSSIDPECRSVLATQYCRLPIGMLQRPLQPAHCLSLAL